MTTRSLIKEWLANELLSEDGEFGEADLGPAVPDPLRDSVGGLGFGDADGDTGISTAKRANDASERIRGQGR